MVVRHIRWAIVAVSCIRGIHRGASAAVNRVYFLRAQSAWAATQLKRALAYKGFFAYRRPFGEAQVRMLSCGARGDAERIKLERLGDRVERAGQLHDVPTWLRCTIPDIDTTGHAGENRDLAVGVAWARTRFSTSASSSPTRLGSHRVRHLQWAQGCPRDPR